MQSRTFILENLFLNPKYKGSVLSRLENVIIEVVLKVMGLFAGELVPYHYPSVVLHTKAINSFHLWCMLGGLCFTLNEEQPILVH